MLKNFRRIFNKREGISNCARNKANESSSEFQLEIHRIWKNFGETEVLRGISLSVYKKEILAIVGPSGCGKSTLLSCISGLLAPDHGKIILDGYPVFSRKHFLAPEQRQIGMVFQNYALWPHKTVFENVAYPLQIKKESKKHIKNQVEKYLNIVRLNGFEKRYPHELSGGQQQRIALARALIMSPKLLLLDEPLCNLDAHLRETMQLEIKNLRDEFGLTIIVVTHDMCEAESLADRIVVLDDGKIVI